MTKLDLQKELLEKIKPGVKPSDLKKPKINTPASSPPVSPIIVPIDKKSQSKPESKSISPPLIEIETTEQIKQLQNQVNFHAQTAQTYLTNLQAALARITNLEEEVGDLQEKNEKLTKTIQETKNQSKTTANTKQEETNFTCSSCTRIYNIEYIRLVKKNGKKICRNCTLLMLKRANQLTGKHIVLKVKKTPESQLQTKTFTCQTCLQTSEGEPHQVHITNYQEQGISPRQLANICSTCLNERVILANFYCPRTSEGRDTYDPKEPQFDCDCPTNERSIA